MEKKFIGIDGGGTKTEFVLFAENGHILGRLLLGACNPNTVGMEKTLEVLKEGIDTLAGTEHKISGVFVGAAGLDVPENGNRVLDTLGKLYPDVKTTIGNDIYNVFGCGVKQHAKIAAICGTGVIVFAKNGDNLKRFAGRGFLFDEGGSGFHIGRDAINAVVDVYDGFKERSILTDLVEEQIGGDVWSNFNKLYSSGQSYIASFTPCVVKAYEKGDEVAGEILRKNAKYLAGYINDAAKLIDGPTTVVASGSIFTKTTAVCDILNDELDKKLTLYIPDAPPVFGACVMCAEANGVSTDGLCDNFMDDYNKL
ncbi:MAG: BadF/BadG/BcrA/BcrD ATPase family protein [Eubacteriales bacterium]|nr:BadF/BadG/BcrA/BcrD ATPase family protein [Eubacteriales bacterium]